MKRTIMTAEELDERWFRGWTMIFYFMMLVLGAYGYCEHDKWGALALFGASISGIVICEIRFHVELLRQMFKARKDGEV